jgi:uncharacterized lipoprotein YmbA
MKQLLITLLLFILTACSSKEYYTFGDTSQLNNIESCQQTIAIDKVNVPKYLKDNAIVKQVSPYKVIRIKSANWLTPMQKRLTNVLINYLQKSLNNPNIYLYPWETKKRDTDKRVSLKIQRFIAYNNQVILDASYQIKNLKTKQRTTKLFTTTVATSNTIEGMMKAMEEAYFRLSKEIKTNIIK